MEHPDQTAEVSVKQGVHSPNTGVLTRTKNPTYFFRVSAFFALDFFSVPKNRIVVVQAPIRDHQLVEFYSPENQDAREPLIRADPWPLETEE